MVDSAHAVRGWLLLPRTDRQPNGKRVPRWLILPRGCGRADALPCRLVVPATAGECHATVPSRLFLRGGLDKRDVGHLPPRLLLRRVCRSASSVRGGLLHGARQQHVNSEPVRGGDLLRNFWGELARHAVSRGVILPPRVSQANALPADDFFRVGRGCVLAVHRAPRKRVPRQRYGARRD